MKVQTLYAAAGLVWGLVLGPDTGLFAARVMGDVAWLYKYENGAWADWAIASFGIVIGLTVFFSCYQAGAAIGRRYDEMTEKQLRHTKSVPWSLIVMGIAVGTITVLTVENRQRAVAAYVQEQKDATQRLTEFAETVHRIAGYDVDWPGGGENGQVGLSFSGKRLGEYRLSWRILSDEGKEPLLGGSYLFQLSPQNWKTTFPIGATELANAFVIQATIRGPSVKVDERFRLEVNLIPILGSRQWAQFPEGEKGRLEEGDSPLIKQAQARFNVQFVLQNGQVFW